MYIASNATLTSSFDSFGNELICYDLDTLQEVEVPYVSEDILDDTGSSSTRRRKTGISYDGNKFFTGCQNYTSNNFTIYNLISNETTYAYVAGMVYPYYFFDNGTHIFVIPGYNQKRILCLDSNTYSIVQTLETFPYDFIKAAFVLGNNIYIGNGVQSLCRMNYKNGEFTFTPITGSIPQWASENTYNATPVYGDGENEYNIVSYAALGDTLYCISSYTNRSSDTQVLKTKFYAQNYDNNSLIITTDNIPINRVDLVGSDNYDMTLYLSNVYKVNNNGNLIEVDAKVKNLSGEWINLSK